MWKRIQTLLLSIVSLLLLQMFWMDMGHTTDPQTLTRYTICFYERSQFLLMTLVTFMLSVTTIFYYNKRLMQIRLCLLNSIILFAYQIWILVEFFLVKHLGTTLASQFTLSIASVFPAICIVLLLLSIRYIGKDEIYYAFTSTGAEDKNGGSCKKQKKDKSL